MAFLSENAKAVRGFEPSYCLRDNLVVAMADRFCIYTTDELRRPLVDQLGSHPANHARFVRRLTEVGHANDYLVYLDFIRWMV